MSDPTINKRITDLTAEKTRLIAEAKRLSMSVVADVIPCDSEAWLLAATDEQFEQPIGDIQKIRQIANRLRDVKESIRQLAKS